jgi:hypothetical protein
MKRWRGRTIACLIVLAAHFADAREARGGLMFQATMNGGNVRPIPLDTPGTGLATLALNDTQTQLDFVVSFKT